MNPEDSNHINYRGRWKRGEPVDIFFLELREEDQIESKVEDKLEATTTKEEEEEEEEEEE